MIIGPKLGLGVEWVQEEGSDGPQYGVKGLMHVAKPWIPSLIALAAHNLRVTLCEITILIMPSIPPNPWSFAWYNLIMEIPKPIFALISQQFHMKWFGMVGTWDRCKCST